MLCLALELIRFQKDCWMCRDLSERMLLAESTELVWEMLEERGAVDKSGNERDETAWRGHK